MSEASLGYIVKLLKNKKKMEKRKGKRCKDSPGFQYDSSSTFMLWMAEPSTRHEAIVLLSVILEVSVSYPSPILMNRFSVNVLQQVSCDVFILISIGILASLEALLPKFS